MGIKILGPDLALLSELSQKAAAIVLKVPGTTSAYPDRTVGGNYLDINIDRKRAARYGLTVGQIQDVISSAMGGMKVTTAVEGLERYPINLRYVRDLRDTPETIRQILVATPDGVQVPVGQLATIEINRGPPMIKSDNSRRSASVYVDMTGRDLGSYIADAQKAIGDQLDLRRVILYYGPENSSVLPRLMHG